MGAIGDLFYNLLFQDSQLVAEGKRAGTKAGDAVGKTMSQKIKASLGPAVAAGVGSVLGAGFALAAKGAAELDAATRQFQADTGATAEEARQASHAIAGMYRDNLQGFDQISAALSKVHTDLGLTGQEAEKVTERFLKFGTATGQDAATAVSSMDDILDAWNLTASETPAILDLLVASHQKYGGSIDANMTALGQLAPAMQALGADTNDTVGLLNLFASSGIDASKATAALNKAVAGLKPGQTLNDLIKQISSIEDPTLRAQEAVKVFGARGGVALANALRPGINSLEDFVPAAEDVAGATDRAADAIESSFGNQFQLLMKNAGGALAEFGNNFGPLLLVASQFGPKMIAGIGAGLGAITGKLFPGLIAKILPSMAVAGTTTGAAMGTSAAVAEVAAQTTGVAAGQAAVGAAAAGPAAAAGTSIGTAMGTAAAAAFRLLMIGAIVALPVLLKESGILDQITRGINETIFGKEHADRVDAFNASLRKPGDAPSPSNPFAGGIFDPNFRDPHANVKAGKEIFGPLFNDLARVETQQVDATEEVSAALTEGQKQTNAKLTDAQRQAHSDLGDAVAAIKANDPKLIGPAISNALAAIMGGTGSAATTQNLVDDLKVALAAAEAANNKPLAAQIKAAIGQLEPMVKGRQWQADQLAKAREIAASTKPLGQKTTELAGIQKDLLSHNRTMAADIVGGLRDVVIAVDSMPLRFPGAISAEQGGGFVPREDRPGYKPPASTPKPPATIGGLPPGIRAFGGAANARSPYWVGEREPELFVPNVSGSIVPASDLPGMAGGNTTINVPIQGLIPYRDAMTIPNQLKRLRDFGVLTPRREPA